MHIPISLLVSIGCRRPIFSIEFSASFEPSLGIFFRTTRILLEHLLTNPWKRVFFSTGGKKILIKSVGQVILMYDFQHLEIEQGISDKMELNCINRKREGQNDQNVLGGALHITVALAPNTFSSSTEFGACHNALNSKRVRIFISAAMLSPCYKYYF
ncbi:uncharacterized protein LOC120068285 [Benincasa hispida]|uniref:uncharacterized protein LOC120068285 n=1 Tax=Benincasa hispida TaxID=102211 RepID=UPI0019021F61|nr:uncharacterized protein LOC120068285 [Benincasa hispida]